MRFFGLLRRRPHDRAGFALYGAAVRAARQPAFYARFGVADTLDGRFDMVSLFAFLLIRRLQHEAPPGPALAQAVFDAMFADMDVNLREMGVSDLAVGKRVRTMWEAFHGRCHAYEQALRAADRAALEATIARNVWRGAEPPAGAAAALARLALANAERLAGQPLAAFARGEAGFLAPEEAAA